MSGPLSPRRGARWDALPWWLLVLLGAGAWLAWRGVTDADYRAVFDVLRQGIGVTVFVALVAFALSVGLGLPVALAGQARWRVLREAARLYCELLRGVPVLVLLFYVAFVAAPALVALANLALSWPIRLGWMDAFALRDFSLLWRAILALAISYSAFVAEVFRAGLEAVPAHHVQAARALGMTGWQLLRHIRLPLALRTVLPPLGNDFIAIVKDSALVSVLGVADVTQMAKVYASGTFQFFETYNVLACVYLVMTVGLSLALRGLERRLGAGR